MDLVKSEASHEPVDLTFASTTQALETLTMLEEQLVRVVERMRQVSAPPDGRQRHIAGMKIADVCAELGVSASQIRENEARLPRPIGWNPAKTQRIFFPEDMYHLRKTLGVGLRAPDGARSHVIAVANQKGGVAKTTTTVTLAQDAAFRGLRVLMIDLDPQASTTASFLIESEVGSGRLVEGGHADLSIDSTISPVLLGSQTDPRPLIRKTHWSTIDLIPSTPDLVEAEFDMINQFMSNKGPPAFWTALRNALRTLTVAEYDLIIIDTPPTMSLVTIAVTVAAHGLLVPIPPRNLDIESLRAFIRTNNAWLRSLSSRIPLDLRWIRFLTTIMRSDSQAENRNDLLLRQRLGGHFLPDVIPRSEALQRASGGAPSVYEIQPESQPSAQKSAAAARKLVHRVYTPIFDLVAAAYAGRS